MQGMNAVFHPTIALLQTSSLTTVVQQEIERAILVGEYEPGCKLIEAALAEKMGVSRGPVREAFRMLEEAGLVRNEKNRGVFVRDIPIEEAIEIFDLRAAMDELVGRQLARNISPAQLKEIRALVDSMWTPSATCARHGAATIPASRWTPSAACCCRAAFLRPRKPRVSWPSPARKTR